MSENKAKINPDNDPLLALRGSGEDIWADEPADDYIRRLREGWDEAGSDETVRNQRTEGAVSASQSHER